MVVFLSLNIKFLNILKNSYESSEKKNKVISVQVYIEKKFIVIIIEDNGTGFPENRDKLFEPYITNKINGTGLGLAIVKHIIEGHKTKIKLKSKINKGSIFSFNLKLAPKSSKRRKSLKKVLKKNKVEMI